MRKIALFASVSVVCFGLLALSIFLNMDNFAPRDVMNGVAVHEGDVIQEDFVFGASPIEGEVIYYDIDDDVFLTAFPLYRFRHDLREVHDEIEHMSEMIEPMDSFLFIMNEGGISTGGFMASDLDIQSFAVLPRSDLWILNNFDRYLAYYLESGTMQELKIVYDMGVGGSVRFFFVNGDYNLIEASLQASAESVAQQQTCFLMSEELARTVILDNVAEAARRGLYYPGLLIRNDSLHRLYHEAIAPSEIVAVQPLSVHPLSEGIRMEIQEFDLRSGRMAITFINDTDDIVRVNTKYELEFYNGEFWQNVPTHPGISFPFTPFSILPQRSNGFIVFLENFASQDTGVFRIRRDFEVEGSYGEFDVVVEFHRP